MMYAYLLRICSGFLQEEEGDGTTTIGGHAQSGVSDINDDTDVSALP